VPLSKLQTEILELLAAYRDPESYVAGSTPLNRDAIRFSNDIDIFHDREDRVAQAAMADAAVLRDAGFSVVWRRQLPLIYTATVSRDNTGTHLDWVADSDYRFFPTLPDPLFGYILHPADLAMNKVMAAAGRREPRDAVDLVSIHQRVLPLGAVVWAAVDKAPGFTPEGLIAEIRRTARYSQPEWASLSSSEPLDPVQIALQLRIALEDAEAFVARMPTEKAGLLFLDNGCVVQPDPSCLERYETHSGRRRGHWPSSPEISSAMLEQYDRKPQG
jgi:hypothetical protein